MAASYRKARKARLLGISGLSFRDTAQARDHQSGRPSVRLSLAGGAFRSQRGATGRALLSAKPFDVAAQGKRLRTASPELGATPLHLARADRFVEPFDQLPCEEMKSQRSIAKQSK